MNEDKPKSAGDNDAAAAIYTIGHSTRSWDEFVAMLRAFRIGLLADVRRFPASRRHPQFSREHMAAALPEDGVRYAWFESLGGRRGPTGDGGGELDREGGWRWGGLRNASFRAYAVYMHTARFTSAVDELLALAAQDRIAIMCAEAVYWRCHRRLISDYLLLARGVPVQHIMSPDRASPHKLTDCARPQRGNVIYPPPLFDQTDE